MRHIKSERLKKLESELIDLQQWLKLGLVPKKDEEKHKEEIRIVQAKIEDEKERLQFLRESGDAEDYVAPKRTATRTAYTEMPTIPDIEAAETQQATINDTQFGMETEGDTEVTVSDDNEDEATQTELEDEESYFSDRNRWRRGRDIMDPDADAW